MIKLFLKRSRSEHSQEFTEGSLFVNGSFFCNTLEPSDRGLRDSMSLEEIASAKIKGKTAVPRGSYYVQLAYSPRFSNRPFYKSLGGCLPLLLAVPGFSGVLIHCGNTVADSSACILVGVRAGAGILRDSQATYRKLMKELKKGAKKGENIFLQIGV